MPTIELIIGQAGTGKTTRIIEAIKSSVQTKLLFDFQKVLVLCRMHGARRRVLGILSQNQALLKNVKIETIDSFAYRILNRYRRFLDIEGTIRPSGENDGWNKDIFGNKVGFDATVTAAVRLMKIDAIIKQIALAYPVIVIDEFQDCIDARLEIVMNLGNNCNLILAADDFQLLEEIERPSPSVSWATEKTIARQLNKIKRTDCEHLINTARILRSGVFEQIPIIKIIFDESSGGLCAWEIAKHIEYEKWHGTTAILSNTIGTSYFHQVITSLNHPLGRKEKIGPFKFEIESPHVKSNEEEVTTNKIIRNVDSTELEVNEIDSLIGTNSLSLEHQVCHHLQRICKLKGVKKIPITIVRETISRLNANRINFAKSTRKRLAMTIHSAKNREFDYVFILWPYQITGSALFRRKLLYNAVTRARKNALIIVQGSQEKRIQNDPVLQLLCGHKSFTIS